MLRILPTLLLCLLMTACGPEGSENVINESPVDTPPNNTGGDAPTTEADSGSTTTDDTGSETNPATDTESGDNDDTGDDNQGTGDTDAGGDTETDTGSDTDSTEPDTGDTGNTDEGTTEEQPDAITWYQPPLSASWQWQLTGTINTDYAVDIYDIDLFDNSASLIAEIQATGKKVICYFSGGSWEEWRDDANQFTPEDLGATLDGWPDEKWLDVRSTNVRTIMLARLDVAKEKGCDGVEPDNMDGYSNAHGVAGMNAAAQLEYNQFIAEAAHERGLSVALKNDLDQVAALVDYFDFAVNEQCFQYNECDLLTPFIEAGKPVLNAEYKGLWKNDADARAVMCSDSINRQFSTLVLPLNLNDNFRYSCF